MFEDGRSRSIVFVAHCILNQNAVSDGTATSRGPVWEILEIFRESGVGIIQMPCPEVSCLGLDRGDPQGGSRGIIEENSRIRDQLGSGRARDMLRVLAEDIALQALKYRVSGFEIKGVVGIDRSPSCGVYTTSKAGTEIEGKGVFIELLRNSFERMKIDVPFVGIKAFEIEKAASEIKLMLKETRAGR